MLWLFGRNDLAERMSATLIGLRKESHVMHHSRLHVNFTQEVSNQPGYHQNPNTVSLFHRLDSGSALPSSSSCFGESYARIHCMRRLAPLFLGLWYNDYAPNT